VGVGRWGHGLDTGADYVHRICRATELGETERKPDPMFQSGIERDRPLQRGEADARLIRD